MDAKDLFHFKILTPSGIFIEGQVSQVKITTYVGQLGIMAKHEPLVAACPPGQMSICQDGEWISFTTSRAIVTVNADGVTLLTSIAKLAV